MESGDKFRTVADRGEAGFEVRGSEFIGHAAPVSSVERAEAFISEIGSSHPDATHTVPAYRVRTEAAMVKAWSSDAGEPTGSAGKPALNVLEQRGIVDVSVVVTRYFGGTELGVGGLARAYSRAASAAIDAAGTVEREPHREVTITLEYPDSGTVRGIIESKVYDFVADYAETVEFRVEVPVANGDEFLDRVQSATSGQAEIDR